MVSSESGEISNAELATRLDDLARKLDRLSSQVADVRSLVGPFAVPMPENRMLVQTLWEVKYLIDPADLIMAPQLIVYRQWEPELSALMARLITPDTVFVDVGANFGYFSCLAAARIGAGGKGRVLAVEPNPRLVELLRANVAINWSMAPVQIVEAAAGPAMGRAQLTVPGDRAANATLSQGFEGGDVVDVDLVTLDSLLEPGTAVDILKVDVEGHETGVLQGARRVLAESPSPTVILEWSIEQMAGAGYPAEAMVELFAELGLKAFEARADGDPRLGAAISAEQLLATPYANIVLRKSH